MAFSRQLVPCVTLEGRALDSAMVDIGMNFGSKGARGRTTKAVPPIEDVLFFASRLGMEDGDFRVLSVLTKWIDVHASRIHIDRLTRLVQVPGCGERTRTFWAAVGQWRHSQGKDARFSRLAKLRSPQDRLDHFGEGTEFQLRRRGEHPWFAETCLRLAAGTLRDRDSDVISPAKLAQCHSVYRQRVIQGPSYRADMWAVLGDQPQLTAAGLARCTYGSFATAWEVTRDRALLESTS